jgi:hypothetical protein
VHKIKKGLQRKSRKPFIFSGRGGLIRTNNLLL